MKFFFRVFKTNIVNLIKLVLIKTRLKNFSCFLQSTYYFILVQKYFIHCTTNNSIIILLPVKFISCYGIAPVALSRSYFDILRSKVSQDLAFILWRPGAMYKTGFWLTLRLVYRYFYAVASALTHLEVIMWQGEFPSLFPAVTSTSGIYPSRFLYEGSTTP